MIIFRCEKALQYRAATSFWEKRTRAGSAAFGPFSTYVALHRKVLPPEPHRYLPTRAARAARGGKSYLPTYLA